MKTRNILLFCYLITMISVIMGPLDKAEFFYDMSRALQALARKTGQLAIKLETKAFEEVNS